MECFLPSEQLREKGNTALLRVELLSPLLSSPISTAMTLLLCVVDLQNQTESNSCSYTVTITTSCSSVRFTRDSISLAFGDAYGNQVYAPRLDDPSSRTFEECSTDTFHIRGPCTYRICFLYLYRAGYDGWKPETVTVYGPTSKVSFYYNTFIPNGIWYGFNLYGGVWLSDSHWNHVSKESLHQTTPTNTNVNDVSSSTSAAAVSK